MLPTKSGQTWRPVTTTTPPPPRPPSRIVHARRLLRPFGHGGLGLLWPHSAAGQPPLPAARPRTPRQTGAMQRGAACAVGFIVSPHAPLPLHFPPPPPLLAASPRSSSLPRTRFRLPPSRLPGVSQARPQACRALRAERRSLGGSGAWGEKEQGPRASAGAVIWLEARPRLQTESLARGPPASRCRRPHAADTRLLQSLARKSAFGTAGTPRASAAAIRRGLPSRAPPPAPPELSVRASAAARPAARMRDSSCQPAVGAIQQLVPPSCWRHPAARATQLPQPLRFRSKRSVAAGGRAAARSGGWSRGPRRGHEDVTRTSGRATRTT